MKDTILAMNAFIDMSAQSCSAATWDGQQCLDVQTTQPRSLAFDEVCAVLAKNIGQLQGGADSLFNELSRTPHLTWIRE